MAGHSQFKNIMHRKGAQDAKKAKIFTKLTREIIVAARTGQPDPNFNPRLRSAILAARAANMTKDKIESAIKKGSTPAGGENYDEMRYEGYGPGGIAIIVDALTDNRNRTAGDIRSLFTKCGGTMGETGSVSFMFERIGFIQYPAAKAKEEEMFDAIVEAGAEDSKSDDSVHEIYTTMEKFNEVKENLIKKFGDPETAKLAWQPKNTVPVDGENAEKLLKLIDLLEDNDDVQNVTANFEIADDVMQKLSQKMG